MKKRMFCAVFQLIFLFGMFSALCAQTTEQRLKTHVETLADDSFMGREAGSEYAMKAADYIIRQWTDMGISPLNGDSYLNRFMNKYHNIIGVIEGKDPALKNEYIVVGAHYDHLGFKTSKGDTIVYNGADDNASGVAALIELARKLKDKSASLGRSVILVAFDAEEVGLFGSTAFADNPPVPEESIKLMLSVDMVGWYKTSGYVKYIGAGTIKNGKALLLDSRLTPDGLNVRTQSFERSMFTATDTRPFAQHGIPTLAVTTGLKSPYHKPGDDPELIDIDGLTRITEHLSNVVFTASTDGNYQASGKIASIHKPPGKLNFGITLAGGYNHHYYTAGALDGKQDDAFGIGIMAQLNMKYFAIRPEVLYEYVEARHPLGDIHTHGLTVPLNFVLQTPPSKQASFAIMAGPYYSYKFAGKQNGAKLNFDNVYSSHEDETNYGIEQRNAYNPNEIGISYGMELRVVKFRLGVFGRDALTNFSRIKNEDGAHIRNRAYYLTLGYNF
jgi:hypothetical protein